MVILDRTKFENVVGRIEVGRRIWRQNETMLDPQIKTYAV